MSIVLLHLSIQKLQQRNFFHIIYSHLLNFLSSLFSNEPLLFLLLRSTKIFTLLFTIVRANSFSFRLFEGKMFYSPCTFVLNNSKVKYYSRNVSTVKQKKWEKLKVLSKTMTLPITIPQKNLFTPNILHHLNTNELFSKKCFNLNSLRFIKHYKKLLIQTNYLRFVFTENQP